MTTVSTEKSKAWDQYIKGTIDASTQTPTERIAAMILGEFGSGKSWLTATAPKPIFNATFDDRSSSLAGKPQLTIKNYRDVSFDTPTAFKDFDSDLNSFEWLYNEGQRPFETFVIDPLDYFLKIVQNQMMAEDPNLLRKRKILGKDMKIPQGYDAFTVPKRTIEWVFNRIRSWNVNLLVTAHIRQQKASDSTEDNPKFTGKWTVEPQNLQELLGIFNERWFMKDNYKVQVTPDYEFNATTALRGLSQIEEPDIIAMIAKHTEYVRKNGVK